MRSLRRSAAHAGFTLIELVVTMALAIVFLVVAVPSMQDFMASQQVAATATSLQTAAMQARSRAMQDNRRVMVQPFCHPDTASCSSPPAWADGWQVYVDVVVDQSYQAGTDTLVATEAAAPSGVTVTKESGTNDYFAYDGSGFLASIGGSSNARWKIASSRTSRIRCMYIERSGRVRIFDPNPSTTCPTSTS